MRQAGVKGIHIAERDTQRSKKPKPPEVFVNTWSVEGFLSEGMQPAELGWGTHEKWMPANAPYPRDRLRRGDLPDAARRQHARAHMVPDARRAVRLPRHPQRVDLDRRLFHGARRRGRGGLPADLPLRLSSGGRRGAVAARAVRRAGKMQEKHHILDENEIVDGIDELGVLLYGHGKNAYWFGSQLSIEETRELAPYQNATGLQVTSAVLGGMVWALENPNAGIVEADEMDFRRLPGNPAALSRSGEGLLHRLDAAAGRPGLFPEDIDTSDPWQFRNVLVRLIGLARNEREKRRAPCSCFFALCITLIFSRDHRRLPAEKDRWYQGEVDGSRGVNEISRRCCASCFSECACLGGPGCQSSRPLLAYGKQVRRQDRKAGKLVQNYRKGWRLHRHHREDVSKARRPACRNRSACAKCEDAKKNAPVLGLDLNRGNEAERPEVRGWDDLGSA